MMFEPEQEPSTAAFSEAGENERAEAIKLKRLKSEGSKDEQLPCEPSPVREHQSKGETESGIQSTLIFVLHLGCHHNLRILICPCSDCQ